MFSLRIGLSFALSLPRTVVRVQRVAYEHLAVLSTFEGGALEYIVDIMACKLDNACTFAHEHMN